MNELRQRKAAIEIAPEEFRKIGYQVVDQLADFLEHLPQQPVTPGETPTDIRKLLGNKSLPDEGVALESLLDETIALLVNHSLFNGHPRFWGYITSSAAPIGALGDFIAGTINSNVGAWIASLVASEIETQTIQWIAEMLGYPSDCGGLLVSGGNVANFMGFLAARNSKVTWDVRKNGIAHGDSNRLIVYCSAETHTWIDKAVDLHGLGSNSARWIKTDAIEASSIHTSLICGFAHTTIPRAAFFKKLAPCGFASESFSSRPGSVTTTNSHEFLPLDVGARSTASTIESIFSASTCLSRYFRILRRFCASARNMFNLLERT